MTRCMQIFGAYSYRLSRKHSTILLIASFILVLTIIFQLYAYKHQDMPRFAARIGDFDYRPGAFLRGNQPNENISYCHFNYGLPETIIWSSIQILPSPEGGAQSPYMVIYNAVQGTAFANHSKYNAVTYATQATPEFIYHIVEIARYWDGPISLAVFVPNYDLEIAMQIMNQLCRCYPAMSKVSVHLFYPKRFPPTIYVRSHEPYVTTVKISTTTQNVSNEEILARKLEQYRKLNNRTRAEYIHLVRKRKMERMMAKLPVTKQPPPKLTFNDCSGLEVFEIPTYRRVNSLIYPINVGRNVARNASRTNYFIVSDIEMVPSDGLATKFLTMVRKLMGDKKRDEGCIFAKTVFVVPLFEVERGTEIPRDKYTLVRLVTENRAKYFHQHVCSHCQRFPGLQSWLLAPPPQGVEPLLIARREYPYHRWEPLYFGTQSEPWYSEMLSWEGRQDKMAQASLFNLSSSTVGYRSPVRLPQYIWRVSTWLFSLSTAFPNQMLEMCLQRYWLVILDGGFMCHTHRVVYVKLSDDQIYRTALLNVYRVGELTWKFQNKYKQRIAKTQRRHRCDMLEMCLLQYRMVVLDGAFLCHAAVTRNGSRHNRAERMNYRRYQTIIASFRHKYPNRPKCKLMYGSS